MYPQSSLGNRARSRSIRFALRSVLEPLESRLLMDAAEALQAATLSLWALPLTDSSPAIAWLDSDANLLAQADSPAQTPNLFDPSSAPTTASGLPILNSLPGAPVAIYLDLDGDAGTSTTAYDEDGHPATFNADEQAHIGEAWRQMAVYFAMFDINVTTQPPSVPMVYDVIGNNAGGATGGYAYVGTFPNTSPQAFNNSSNVRSRVSAIAHEVGHVFGLDHQSTYDLLGNKTAEYASATDPLHGPLMGVDYSGDVHKWFIGHSSSSASTLQDDMQVIAGKIKTYERAGGDGFRRDDYDSSFASATALPIIQGLQSISGIIERLADSDTFSFLSGGGPTRISALPDSPSGVDLKLQIYDAAGVLLASKDTETNEAQVTVNLPAGMYYATLASHGNYGDVGVYKLSVSSLATGWKNQDIGSTGLAGYARFDASTDQYIIAGAGADIGATSDSFQFAYQTLTGDGTIIARLDNFDAAASGAKAGLMIRDSLNANARCAAILATPESGPQMLWRTSTGATASKYLSTATPFSPIWLKLVREGSTFTTYTSSDGVDFTLWNTATINMAAKVYIGLAVSSQNRSALAAANFTNITLDGTLGDPAPTYNTLPAPAGFTASPGTGTGIDLAWEIVPNATSYAIERSSDGVAYTRIAARAADVTTYSDNNLAGAKCYFYRISALDDAGASISSPVLSIVNRPSAPTGLTITSLNTTTLVLNWKDVDGETGYRIERSSDGTTFTTRGTVGKNIPSYTDNNLSAGTTYYYRVTPTSALGDSPDSAVATGVTRLAAVTGIAFDSITSNRIAFHWSNATGESGYRIERSTDGTTYTTLTTLAADVTTYADTTVKPMTEYYYRVFSLKGTALSVLPTAIFAATPATTSLRAPWLSKDIGAVKGAGASSSTTVNNTFTLIGNGSDIWDRADAFRYTYQPLIGDGQIIARVSAVEDTDGWAKVGLMIRESLNANARNAFIALTPDNGITLQYRTSSGGTTSNITGAKVSAPYYLKLVRKANTFTGYASSDGANWITVGTINIAMGTSAFIGLAVTSHTDTELNTTTFDKVSVANRAPTVATPASISVNPVASTSALLSINGSDDHGETNLIYSWETTALPPGASTPTFSDNDSNDAKNTTVTFTQAGTYTFLGTITDSSGLTTTSSVTVTVAQTPTAAAITPISTPLLLPGQTHQFSLLLTDQFNHPITPSPLPQWQVTAGGGTIDSTGLFIAPQTPQDSTIAATIGSLSATITVTTTIPNLAQPTHLAPYLHPGGVLELQWHDNSDGETGFQIERSIDNEPFGTIATTAPNQTTFIDPNPAPGIVLYRIAAIAPGITTYADTPALALVGDDSDDLFVIRNDSSAGFQLRRNTNPQVPVSSAVLANMALIGRTGHDTLQASDCSLTFSTDLGNATSALTLRATRTNLTFTTSQHLASLALGPSSTAILATPAPALLSTHTLSIDATATLDLSSNSLIVSATPETRAAVLAAISNAVKRARGTDGKWAGAGLSSSSAKTSKQTGLAVMLNNKNGAAIVSQFAGQSVGVNDILVKYTWNGDVNLDGQVDAADYFLVDSGYITQEGQYRNGDLNLDGVVDAADYFLVDSAYIAQTGVMGAKAPSVLQQLFSSKPVL